MEILLNTEDVVEIDDALWFSSKEFNGLYRVKQGELAELIGIIPTEECAVNRLFSSIEYDYGKVFLIPFWATSIAVYDTIRNCFYSIGNDAMRSMQAPYFFASKKVNHKIYLFGVKSCCVLVIDTENDETYIIDIAGKQKESIQCDKNDAMFYREAIVKNNVIQIFMANADYLLTLDTITDETTLTNLHTGSRGYIGAVYDGKKIYGLPRKFPDGIVEIDMSGIINVVSSENSEYAYSGFVGARIQDEKIIGFSSRIDGPRKVGSIYVDYGVNFVSNKDGKIYLGKSGMVEREGAMYKLKTDVRGFSTAICNQYVIENHTVGLNMFMTATIERI